jgi:uncharacterized membrane-anchored protein YjiN (DUF445 family)
MKNNSTILIEVLLKTIDKMGIKRTIQVLEVSNNYSDENKRLIDLIILNTCKYFDISEAMLKKGTIRNPSRINALGVCSVLLMRMCKLSQREIAEILHKDSSLINKYVRRYQTLNSNLKEDAELLEKMEAIRTDALTQFEINK